MSLANFFISLLLIYLVFNLTGTRTVNKHLPLYLFLLFLLPYSIRVMLTTFFEYDYSALELLDSEKFLYYTVIFQTMNLLAVFFYFYFYRRKRVNLFIINHTSTRLDTLVKLDNHLPFKLLCIGLTSYFVGIYLTYNGFLNQAMLFSGDIDNIDQSREGGWTQLSGVFYSLTMLSMLCLLEIKRIKFAGIMFFFLMSVGVITGSKSGPLGAFLIAYLYLVIRRRVLIKFNHLVVFIALFVISVTIGTYARLVVATGIIGSDLEISYLDGLAAGFNRFHGMEYFFQLLDNPKFIYDVQADFVNFLWQSAIPGAFWTDKPISPAFKLNTLLSPNQSAKAISASWAGGIVLIFGHLGIILGPILVGYFYSKFSVAMYQYREKITFAAPFAFSMFFSLHSIISEGTFFQALFILITFYFKILVLYFLLRLRV